MIKSESPADNQSFEVHKVWLIRDLKRPEVITGTSGHDRELKILDLNSPSDYDSFEVHKVWLILNFKQPEVITGTFGYDRSVKISDLESTPSIYSIQFPSFQSN